MDQTKKTYVTPELQIFGDIETLTLQGKGQGTGDSLNTNPANTNTGFETVAS